jgi:plastocyanin
MILLLFLACGDGSGDIVQESSAADPSWFVSVSATDGFIAECKTIGAGDTVEWENMTPQVPANVTSLGEPVELYSPNLQGAYVTWRHTFPEPGFYDYYDTNTGDPGRKVIDAYYGTVTYVGTSGDVMRGAICVPSDTTPCCCTTFDCDIGQTCAANTCTDPA